MALRDKLRDRAQPFLEPGEAAHQVLLAQTGPSPYVLGALGTLLLFFVKRRVIVVTDRAVVVMRAGAFAGTYPKEVLARLPRSTRIGPVSGLWSRIELNGERLWVHKRFQKDVEAADAGAPAAG